MTGQKQEETKQPEVTMAQVVKAILGLGGDLKTLRTELNELRDTKPNVPPTPREADTAKPPTAQELEAMSREEYATYLVERIAEEVINPIRDRIDRSEIQDAKSRVETQAAEAAQAHPDFMEWRDEMREIFKQFPQLDVEDVYSLARSRNPRKAGEIDARLKEEEERKAEKENAGNKDVFGGLLPTRIASSPRSDMKVEDAAAAAWDDVIGSQSLYGEE